MELMVNCGNDQNILKSIIFYRPWEALYTLDINIKTRKVGDYEALIWIAILGLLYKISLENYLLFHTMVDSFSAYFSYVIFLIVWKSRNRLENPYFLVIGISFVFIGWIDFLQALAFKGMDIFHGYNADFSIELWTVSSYIESSAFLAAPLFLMYTKDDGNKNNWIKNNWIKYSGSFKGATFTWKVFLVYALVTIICLLSIFSLRDFPNTYIEGSGFTPFKIESEYIISIILLCSLFLLCIQKKRFEKRIFKLFAIAIVLAVFEELSFTLYTQVNQFPNFIGYCFKLLLFYLIYKAIVEIGFEGPNSLFFRELKSREEDFRQKAIFLGDEYSRICRKIGITKHLAEHNIKNIEEKRDLKNDYSFIKHFSGIKFQFDENFTLKFINGPVEEMTGYRKEDILSGKVDWIEMIIPEDQLSIFETREKLKSDSNFVIENEFRMRRKNGEIKWVREITHKVSDRSETSVKFQGLIYDITERKTAEEVLEKINKLRIKEIHHRIKNNLQVISSLLSLQAEKFEDKEVLEAFRESQNRIASIAMIHEELHEGENMDTLDFADYLRKLTADLLSSYRVGNDGIRLKLDLEQVYLSMDVAIPLGIIVNELVSNSLKYAFPAGSKGEIHINFCKIEIFTARCNVSTPYSECLNKNDFRYMLVIADNGKGIPKEIDFINTESLGLQLVNILVEQIDGCIELKRNKGTKYIIQFLSNSDLHS